MRSVPRLLNYSVRRPCGKQRFQIGSHVYIFGGSDRSYHKLFPEILYVIGSSVLNCNVGLKGCNTQIYTPAVLWYVSIQMAFVVYINVATKARQTTCI